MQYSKEYKITTTPVDSKFKPVRVTESDLAYGFAKQFYHEDINIYESFFVILLDRGNNTIGWAKISQGGMHGTVVDIKLVLKYAVDACASSIILVHNHPSGTKQPSTQDLTLTQRIKKAATYLDVSMLDHIIITADGYYSFADEGRL